MKLYSTITSERASKSQGGNKFISVSFQAGEERVTMLEATLETEETDTKNIYKLWNGDIMVDSYEEIKKGKKQKSE